MGAIVMKQFIDRFKAMEKIANETLAANPEALVGVSDLPGSEHDAKAPAEAKKDDKEVQQGQPAGATSTDGAVAGGDAKPLNEGKLEMDQALTNPEQKPLTSDDALTAKTASAQLMGLVKDLLSDLKGTQKTAGAADAGAQAGQEQKKTDVQTKAAGDCGGCAKPDAKAGECSKAGKCSKDGECAKDGEGECKGDKKKSEPMKIALDDETISKIAAAQATFMLGREAADTVLKQAAAKDQSVQLSADAARKLIKDACVKAAQEQGLDPNAAAAAADNAMAAAGLPAEVAAGAGADAGAEAGAAAGAEAGAEAGAGEGGAAAEEMELFPEDVTEEELATAIIDCVSSGELDPDTAKALVEEIATDGGAAAPSEDEAAAIIAQGLESGQITPEQAQEIATSIENGGEGGAGAGGEGDAAAEAQGAADAAAAAQDAQDEAQGAADAEAAMKEAAAHVRKEAIAKVAAAVQEKREQVKKEAAAKEASAQGAAAQAAGQEAAGNRIMAKVASILKAKNDAKAKAEAAKQASAGDASYIAGFKKKAEELGVDPAQLAKYMLARKNAAR